MVCKNNFCGQHFSDFALIAKIAVPVKIGSLEDTVCVCFSSLKAFLRNVIFVYVHIKVGSIDFFQYQITNPTNTLVLLKTN